MSILEFYDIAMFSVVDLYNIDTRTQGESAGEIQVVVLSIYVTYINMHVL